MSTTSISRADELDDCETHVRSRMLTHPLAATIDQARLLWGLDDLEMRSLRLYLSRPSSERPPLDPDELAVSFPAPGQVSIRGRGLHADGADLAEANAAFSVCWQERGGDPAELQAAITPNDRWLAARFRA